MPLRKAVILYSVLFFAVVVLCSSFAYYFSIRKILSASSEHEYEQVLDTRRLILSSKLNGEILLLKILSEAPVVIEHFRNPGNEALKSECFSVLEHYIRFSHSKMLGWISAKDSNYYVNSQFMEKYSKSNSAHSWFFETLETKTPPLIRVDFDYLNRQLYDLYINYPVYFEGEAVGVISSRISLFEFVADLKLPENVYVFGADGIVIGAADEKVAREKKTLKELFGSRGEDVYKKSLISEKKPNEAFVIGDRHYLMSSVDDLDLFLAAKYEIDIKKIMHENASLIFFALLFLMMMVFVIFNVFIAYILKPINKSMTSYVKSSLLDELTKLPNRRFFNMRMEEEWRRAVRAEYPISFLMLDLDKFKNYNDAHGHLEGDILLRDSAQIFNSCVGRDSDFVARFGGEEFCIILSNTKIEGAKKIAENIRASVEKAGKITVSIGLACKIPKLSDNSKDFIDAADQKLYEAKNSGRNKVCAQE